jgi:hypothetical protein
MDRAAEHAPEPVSEPIEYEPHGGSPSLPVHSPSLRASAFSLIGHEAKLRKACTRRASGVVGSKNQGRTDVHHWQIAKRTPEVLQAIKLSEQFLAQIRRTLR